MVKLRLSSIHQQVVHNIVTITPSNLRGYTNVLLNAPGETVTLLFKNSNWNIIAGNGYTTS